MPAKRPRVAAYLPEFLHEKFKQFADERKLGDSQALIQVLSEYFGVTHKVTHSESLLVLERVERLESSISTMRSDLLDELKRVVLAELAPKAVMLAIPPSQTEVELLPALPDLEEVIEVVNTCDEGAFEVASIAGEVVSNDLIAVTEKPFLDASVEHISLIAADLAKRFGCSQNGIGVRKKDSPDKFAEWTSKKDPDSIPWAFNPESGTFSPVGDVPFPAREVLRPKVAEGLSHSDLAKRLNVDKSTVSGWKKNKTSEELAKTIQERDPEGFEWILNEDTGRFIRGESSSPRMTQGELPTMGHQGSDDF